MVLVNLDGPREYVEALRLEAARERNAVNRLIAECSAQKTTPPNNYWEKARRAEKRFMMAAGFLAALEESFDGSG